MANGNVWLPEDLLLGIIKYGNEWNGKQGKDSEVIHVGMWGTSIGASTQYWMKAKRRPLVWASE